MRLDKFVANNSNWSRSELKKLLKQARVTLDGVTVYKPGLKVDPHTAELRVDQSRIGFVGKQYYMLHKPAGYVCANAHSEHPVVLDLMSDPGLHPLSKLQIVGRLDLDTTGLVLLTNDGAWNHAVTSPASECTKVYRVELEKAFDKHTLPLFECGMLLDGERKKTRPASLQILAPSTLELSICEGKYHQVKRMFSQCGNRVRFLHRMRIGDITLDRKIAEGQWRELSAREIQSVYTTPAPV